MRMLIQTQLSNYNKKGEFILEADSGWQMVMGRVREMLKRVPNLKIDVMTPKYEQLVTTPENVNQDLWAQYGGERLSFISHWITPNALATRYEFIMDEEVQALGIDRLSHKEKYDWVYMNDPMLLRHFRAMFFLYGKYMPKFAVHSHFIDNPSCPKFPTEASLWWGQMEAAAKADINFWQCQSALDIFEQEARWTLHDDVVNTIMAKSSPWDDGFSIDETTQLIRKNTEPQLRFDPEEFYEKTKGKAIIFVPNRIGGRGRSSDYTNCGKFLFEILPAIHNRCEQRGIKLAVIAGNPSQKFSNQELESELGKYGFISLVPDSLRREEYLWIGHRSEIAVGLYDQDSYGGTAARELVTLGALPLWVDKYEYGSIARAAKCPGILAPPTFDNRFVEHAVWMIEQRGGGPMSSAWHDIRTEVERRCSYEATTPVALKKMGIIE